MELVLTCYSNVAQLSSSVCQTTMQSAILFTNSVFNMNAFHQLAEEIVVIYHQQATITFFKDHYYFSFLRGRL